MPELELDANQCRRLEIHEPGADTWDAWDVEKFAVDGRVLLRSVIRPATADWTDLGSKRYRWFIKCCPMFGSLQLTPITANQPHCL